MSYQEKYLKYKKKYINLKNQLGGMPSLMPNAREKILDEVKVLLKEERIT